MNLKTHLVIIACFVTAISGIAAVVSVWQDQKIAARNDPALAVDDTIYVNIQSATYGNNCHGQEPGISVVSKPSPETLDASGRYKINEGNATQSVAALCNGKKKCTLSVSTQTLGFEPAAGCDKSLNVTFRCFNFDSPHEVETKYNNEMIIDCIPTAKTY